MRFLLEGLSIDPEATAAESDLKDDDLINCYLAHEGGGSNRAG